MRKGLQFLAPFAVVAGLHMACSTVERSKFAPETNPDAGGFGNNFDDTDASTDQQGCSESKTEIARVPVVIEFVVDESGSMSGEKWQAAREALKASFEDMTTTADPATFVGIALYSDSVNAKVDPASLLDPDQLDDLVATIDKQAPKGSGTATEDGLTAGYKVVEKFKPPTSSGIVPDQLNRVVILVSDGVPNGGQTEKTACEDLAEEKFNETPPNGPILTFAVGIGPFPTTSSGYDPTFMGRIAEKGGTAPAGCDSGSQDESSVCHFQITPGQGVDTTKQALLDAINKIRALTASCEFSFTTNQSTDLGSVKVTITDKDGKETSVPKDEENGWSFDDPDNPTKVILRGDACSASNGTVSGRVDVVIGCRGAN